MFVLPVAQAVGLDHLGCEWLSVPAKAPGPEILKFSVVKEWQRYCRAPSGRAVSVKPYAVLSGEIKIWRGTDETLSKLQLNLMSTRPEGSGAFLVILSTLHAASKFEEFRTSLHGLSPSLQSRFQSIVELGSTVDSDLGCTSIRGLLCKYALCCLENPCDDVESMLGKFLRLEWSTEPEAGVYSQAARFARTLSINPSFQDYDTDRSAKMRAIELLSPNFHYDKIVARLLQGFLSFTVATVIIHRKRQKCGAIWIHDTILDFVHPTKSIWWLPMVQRYHTSGPLAHTDHFCCVSFADGSCPVRPFHMSRQ